MGWKNQFFIFIATLEERCLPIEVKDCLASPDKMITSVLAQESASVAVAKNIAWVPLSPRVLCTQIHQDPLQAVHKIFP